MHRNSFAGCLERFLGWLGAVEEGAGYNLPVAHGRAECLVFADRVVCTHTGGPQIGAAELVLPARSDDLAGALPVMKALGDLALVYIPCAVTLQTAVPCGEGANTEISYQYRDSSNFKADGSVVFAGTPAPGETEALISCMNEEARFVPGQVGLPDLQDSFAGPSWWDPEGDGIWHEVTAVRATGAVPTDPRTFSHFVDQVARHVMEQGWDEDYRPQLYEVMRQRYRHRGREEA